jgi:hypothetical protein
MPSMPIAPFERSGVARILPRAQASEKVAPQQCFYGTSLSV